MKKRTIITKLQDRLEKEITHADLVLVGGGKITISGSGKSISACSGDLAV